jgi:hypothetical protein
MRLAGPSFANIAAKKGVALPVVLKPSEHCAVAGVPPGMWNLSEATAFDSMKEPVRSAS